MVPALAPSLAQGSAADPTIRIDLARDFSGDAKLSVSRSGSGFQIGAAVGDSLWVDARNCKVAASVEPAQIVEFQSVADAPKNPLDKRNPSHLVYQLAEGQSVMLSSAAADGCSGGDSDPAPDAFCLQADSRYAAHHFRGAMQITAVAGGALRVINCVPLEEYLKGVVGPEMGESAPLQALKAQAVAARTYTVKNLGKLAFVGADLDDTNRCQNYLGVDAENWRTRTAVEQTAGQVLTYQGSLIDAVYATDCGGMTAEGDEPYLKAVADPECAGASPWSVTVATAVLQSALARSGMTGLATIDSVIVCDRDRSGRVSTLTCTDEATGDSKDVSAALIRKALGYDLLRSTLFSVSMTPASSKRSSKSKSECDESATGTVTFTGKGWGHGLGMCQHGAAEMARLDGATDEQILHHFYFGVDIAILTESMADDAAAKASPSAWSAAGLAAFASKSHRGGAYPRSPQTHAFDATAAPRERDADERDDTDTPAALAAAPMRRTATFPRRGF